MADIQESHSAQEDVIQQIDKNPHILESEKDGAFLFSQLTDPLTPLSLERLAFYKYHENIKLPTWKVDDKFHFEYFKRYKEKHSSASAAGYKRLNTEPTSNDHSFNEPAPKPDAMSSKPWLLRYFIRECSQYVDRWWEYVIPALLNYLDTIDLTKKAEGVRLSQELATYNANKLIKSGLIPVFEEAIDPLLSFLPPMADPKETKLVHRITVNCLAVFARLQPQLICNKRLNYIARSGTLKPFSMRTGNVELLICFLDTLKGFISTSLQSLTIVHFEVIVKVFNQIMSDPFIKSSPALVEACEAMMIEAINWSWPIVSSYKFDILYGLVKAGAMNSKCVEMLGTTSQEKERLSKVKTYT